MLFREMLGHPAAIDTFDPAAGSPSRASRAATDFQAGRLPPLSAAGLQLPISSRGIGVHMTSSGRC